MKKKDTNVVDFTKYQKRDGVESEQDLDELIYECFCGNKIFEINLDLNEMSVYYRCHKCDMYFDLDFTDIEG